MSDRNAHDLLMSGGKAPKGFDFGDRAGRELGGKVVAGPTKYHAREYNRLNPGQGALKYWDDGSPVEGLSIDCQTPMREGPNDDGVRRFYIEKPRMRQAIADAIRNAGSEQLEIDAHLYVTWTGDEMGQGAQPAKTYTARYVPPGQAALSGPAPRVAVASHPSASPATRPVPPDVYYAMVNAGLDVSGFSVLPG